MKELYERLKGTVTPEGIICGYNELKKCLIVEAKNGWIRKHPYDEIFSDATDFLYVSALNIISLGYSHPKIENELLKKIEAIFTKDNHSLLRFLEQYDYYEYNNTPEIFYSKIAESEIFLNGLEKEINDYKFKKFENLISDNDLKFYKSKKKFEQENIRKSCSKKSIWITDSIGILLLFFCFIVFIEARESVSFGDICGFFIITVLMIGIAGIIFYLIFNELFRHLYQLIHKKNIERFNKLQKLDQDIIEENKIVIRVINDSLLRIEKYRQEIVNRTKKFTEEQQTKERLRIQREEEERQREILRKKAEYWLNMDGYSFEDEVSLLFSKIGYKIKKTPYSNDGGLI